MMAQHERRDRSVPGAARALVGVVAAGASVIVLQIVGGMLGMSLFGDAILVFNPTASFDELALDLSAVALLVGQLFMLAVGLWWWRRLRSRAAVVHSGTRHERPRDVTCRVVAIIIAGVAIQMLLSLLLTYILPLFPALNQQYSELMEEPTVGVFAAIALLTTAIGAPVTEEIFVRGIVFEYAARLMSPCHRSRFVSHRAHAGGPQQGGLESAAKGAVATGESGLQTPPVALRPQLTKRQFVIACALQAAVFAVLHLNLVQGSYAFVLGLLQGYVFYRTGALRWPILLHVALNASSLLVSLPPAAVEVLVPSSIVLLPFALWLFDRCTPKARYAAEN